MRIVVCGPNGNDSFADNVADTARRLGHSVFATGAARAPVKGRQVNGLLSAISDQRRDIDGFRQRALANRVREYRADLMISVDKRLHPDVISAAQSVGTRVILWFPDAVHNFGLGDIFLSGYDRIYLKNPLLVEWLRAVQGLRVGLLPEAANSASHLSRVEYGTDRSIIMAGNVHPTRAVLLQRLIEDGIPLKLYGAPIPAWVNFPDLRAAHTGLYLVGEEKARIFRSARGVLNNLHPAEFAGTNCRLYEAAASGGVVLTENRVGLNSQFDPNKEVASYADYAGLLALARTLLEAPQFGRVIGDAAARRAHAEHTYEHRIATIIDDLG